MPLQVFIVTFTLLRTQCWNPVSFKKEKYYFYRAVQSEKALLISCEQKVYTTVISYQINGLVYLVNAVVYPHEHTGSQELCYFVVVDFREYVIWEIIFTLFIPFLCIHKG